MRFDDNYNSDKNKCLIEQYKLYMEMLEGSTKRRMDTNTFFISINAVMVTFSSFFHKGNAQAPVLVAISGILFSLAWVLLLVKYNKVNQIKWDVLYKMEEHLQCNPFEAEWKDLQQEQEQGKKRFYFPISLTEALLPVGFLVIYVYIIKTGDFVSGVADLSDAVASLQDAVSELTAALAEITRAGIGG